MLTPKEVAAILKISYESALAFIKYSGIDYIRIGNQYRVSAEKLKAFLNKKGQTVTDLT
jgi:excisionase family DNA binding protein